MVFEQGLAEGGQLCDLLDLQENDVRISSIRERFSKLRKTTYVVLQQVEHAHLRQMEAFRKLLLGLTNLVV